MPNICTIDDATPAGDLAAPGRGQLTAARLEEHLRATRKRLKKLGIGHGDCLASALPEGPDAVTAKMALANLGASFVQLNPQSESQWFEGTPKLLLMHPSQHTARDAARHLGIPVANVLRHYEAGVFTLEAALSQEPAQEPAMDSPTPAWKNRRHGVSLVLIAPGQAYRRLANRLDADYPVIGITPPSLEHLPPPQTIEHIAAECVRMLRRYRAHGPYALAGWQTQGLVALEMARLLEEGGQKVSFVAMLDASDLFYPPMGRLRRLFFSATRVLRKKSEPSCEFLAQALRQYRPRPWYGKILHIHPNLEFKPFERTPWLDWHNIAPHGLTSYEAPSEMLSEPNVQTVAEILATQLAQSPQVRHAD